MLRSLIALKPRDVPLRVALRNTVAVIAPLALGLAIAQVPAGLAMTTGAINTMFTDQPGPYRQRMQRMLLAALAAGFSALIGILIGEHTTLFVMAAIVFGLAGGLLVALGPLAARVGLTSMIVMMITADMGLPVVQAPGVAAMIFAGGLLQMLLALAAWPLQRYRPERFALATVLQQLAEVARTRPDPSQPPPVSMAAMAALETLHGQHHSRGMAVQSFRIIAELCERVRIDLLALGELDIRIEDADVRVRIEAVLDAADTILTHLSDAMRAAEKPFRAEQEVATFGARVASLANAGRDSHGARDRRLLRLAGARAQSLAGQLRSLVRNSDWASSRGEIRADLAEARLPSALRPRNPWQTLRANLKISSVAMRHAIRCAACLGLAVACERALAIPHGVWIPMTAAIVLKPDFGGTLRFGLLRVAGTFVGLLLTTLIVHYATDGVVPTLLLMTVLCLAFRLLVQVNYGIGVAMLSGMLVLLLSFQGIAPGDAIQMRLFGTLLGSALALAAYLVWPTWEGRRANLALAKLVESYRAHIHAVFGEDITALHETRSTARAARTGVLASLERLQAEPKRAQSRKELALTESFLANAHRLIRTSLSLEAVLRDEGSLPRLPELTDFSTQVDAALAAITTSLREETPLRPVSARPAERRLAEAVDKDPVLANSPAGLALADTCDRIADSVDALAHLLRRARPDPAQAAMAAAG
ncbi:MAG: FUSC family protein [Pseudoxanthomonas sp.]